MKEDIKARINEAEVCRSMGLYDESLDIYKKVISILPKKDVQTLKTVKAKMNEVESELAEVEKTEPNYYSKITLLKIYFLNLHKPFLNSIHLQKL